MQFDVIVKDTEASPDTGWVFTTLFRQKPPAGSGPWDRMVTLGAVWGNDPNSAAIISGTPRTTKTILMRRGSTKHG